MWYLIEITEKNLNVTTSKITETKPSNLNQKQIISTHQFKLQALKALSEQNSDFYMVENNKLSIDKIDDLVIKFSKQIATTR